MSDTFKILETKHVPITRIDAWGKEYWVSALLTVRSPYTRKPFETVSARVYIGKSSHKLPINSSVAIDLAELYKHKERADYWMNYSTDLLEYINDNDLPYPLFLSKDYP